MERPTQLCLNCKNSIGSDEAACPWCGASRTTPWWRLIATTEATPKSGWLVKGILALNLVWFAISLYLSTKIDGKSGFLSSGHNSLFMLGATGTIPIDRYGRIWSLLTANYLHGGILHLVFNMIALRQLARQVIAEYGSSRMFILYTVGGVLGYGMSYLAGIPFTIGASAALCSLIGALLYFGKTSGGLHGNAVYKEVVGWVISLFVFGLIFPGIDNWAHGGGLLGGIGLGLLLGYGRKRDEKAAHRAVAKLCGVMTLIALGWALFGASI